MAWGKSEQTSLIIIFVKSLILLCKLASINCFSILLYLISFFKNFKWLLLLWIKFNDLEIDRFFINFNSLSLGSVRKLNVTFWPKWWEINLLVVVVNGYNKYMNGSPKIIMSVSLHQNRVFVTGILCYCLSVAVGLVTDKKRYWK